MGHRAYIIRNKKAIYSHWGAVETHEYVGDWDKFRKQIMKLSRLESEKEHNIEQKFKNQEEEQKFIEEIYTDISIEAIYHITKDGLVVYIPNWIYPIDNHKIKLLVVIKLESAQDFYHYWHSFRQLTSYSKALFVNKKNLALKGDAKILEWVLDTALTGWDGKYDWDKDKLIVFQKVMQDGR
jgi:hypothetical protein